jgi:hypothetical protein
MDLRDGESNREHSRENLNIKNPNDTQEHTESVRGGRQEGWHGESTMACTLRTVQTLLGTLGPRTKRFQT